MTVFNITYRSLAKGLKTQLQHSPLISDSSQLLKIPAYSSSLGKIRQTYGMMKIRVHPPPVSSRTIILVLYTIGCSPKLAEDVHARYL